MRILSLELIDYIRLRWNQVRRFCIVFEANEHLILGTNGCGKSRILAELTPLPPDKSLFRKGSGKKVIVYEHHGKIYTLTTDYTSKTPHSFLIDGEELNEGGTVTVQRDLVWHHFRYSNEIRNLLQGKETFDKMSPARKREWFTRFSDVDQSYALEQYQRYKALNSQAASGMTFLKRKLVTELEKRQAPEVIAQLEQQVTALQHQLKDWVALRQPNPTPPGTLKTRLDGMLAQLDTQTRVFLKTPYIVPEHDPALVGILPAIAEVHAESLTQHVAELGQQIVSYQSLLDQDVAEHDKLHESIAALKKLGQEGEEQLTRSIGELIDTAGKLRGQRRFHLDFEDPAAAMSALNACQDTLTYVSQTLPANADMTMGRKALEHLESQVPVLNRHILDLKQAITNDEVRLEHLKHHHNQECTVCPACGHSWTLLPKQLTEMSAIQERLPKVRELLKEQESWLANRKEQIDLNQQYIATYRQYMQCVKAWEILKPFWDHVAAENLLLEQPGNLMIMVHQFRNDLVLDTEAMTLWTVMKDKQALLKQVQSTQQGSLDEQVKRDELLQTRITQRQTVLVALRNQKRRFEQYVKVTEEGKKLQQSLLTTEAQFQQGFIAWSESLWQTHVEAEIQQVTEQLAIAQKQLMESQHGQRLIAELEQQIQQAQVEEEATRAIMEALSPTEGLIAEGMLGFIKHFVALMNQEIAKVWTYPLVIQPCRLDEESGIDLDYKFPVQVDQGVPINDVAEGSTSMVEIFNLAFVVTAMRYLGLAESPLFLDEFGSGFDDAHRFESIASIQTLLQNNAFTQLFMVSHYEMTYSAFSDAQVCVLDKGNIALPSGCVYNLHVDMETAV